MSNFMSAPKGAMYMNIQTGEIMPVEEYFKKRDAELKEERKMRGTPIHINPKKVTKCIVRCNHCGGEFNCFKSENLKDEKKICCPKCNTRGECIIIKEWI